MRSASVGTVDMINVINLVDMVDMVNFAQVSSHEFKMVSMVNIVVGAIKCFFLFDNAKSCSDLSQGNSAFPRLDVELWTLMKP